MLGTTGNITNMNGMNSLLLICLISLVSCFQQNTTNETVSIKTTFTCLPSDTTIVHNSDTLSIRYTPMDDNFDIHIYKNGKKIALKYKFTCETPVALIPTFDWTNGNIIALQRGCGSYCQTSVFIDFSAGKIFERDNVIATNPNSGGVIAFIEDQNTIAIEQLSDSKIKKYDLSTSLPCSVPTDCIVSAKIESEILTLNYITLIDGIEVTKSESFKW